MLITKCQEQTILLRYNHNSFYPLASQYVLNPQGIQITLL